jgi:hypothetical protein
MITATKPTRIKIGDKLNQANILPGTSPERIDIQISIIYKYNKIQFKNKLIQQHPFRNELCSLNT